VTPSGVTDDSYCSDGDSWLADEISTQTSCCVCVQQPPAAAAAAAANVSETEQARSCLFPFLPFPSLPFFPLYELEDLGSA